jgi:ankyrin repeat protein
MPILRKLVNVQDNKGKTALHYAVKKCIPTVVAALLSHEDVDATVLDNDGLSAAWELLYNMKKAKTLNWVCTYATILIKHINSVTNMAKY